MNPWIVIPGIVVLAVVYVALPVGLAMSAHYRRWKVVECPMAYRPTAVLVGRAGVAEAFGIRSLRGILGCSLWPARYGCRRGCLALPDGALRDASTAATPSCPASRPRRRGWP